MAWSPVPAGDGRPQPHAFTTDSAIFPLTGLSNSALSLHLQDINNNNVLTICTGTYTITDGPNGKATFTPSAGDLSTGAFSKPGLYKAYPVVTLSTGPVGMDSQILSVISEP